MEKAKATCPSVPSSMIQKGLVGCEFAPADRLHTNPSRTKNHLVGVVRGRGRGAWARQCERRERRPSITDTAATHRPTQKERASDICIGAFEQIVVGRKRCFLISPESTAE